MSKQITRWRPDTCNCVLEYEWDNEDNPVNIQYTNKKIIEVCEYHSGVEDFDYILNENKEKNKTFEYILNNFPNLVDEKEDEHGNISRNLKKGLEFEYSYNGKGNLRKLEINLDKLGMTSSEKNLFNMYKNG